LVAGWRFDPLLTRVTALIERIRLAVLRLADGNPAAILDRTRVAKVNWRDILVVAGFGSDLQAHLRWAAEVTR